MPAHVTAGSTGGQDIYPEHTLLPPTGQAGLLLSDPRLSLLMFPSRVPLWCLHQLHALGCD
jgi:hypothetical protein